MGIVEGLLKAPRPESARSGSELTVPPDQGIAGNKTGADDSSTSANTLFDPVAFARHILALRKGRRDYFPAELFHEPAWEMLIALFIIYRDVRSMNVKQLVACSDAPATTAQRWIDHLYRSGLINRVADTADRRRIDVSLTRQGYDAMLRYLQDVGSPQMR